MSDRYQYDSRQDLVRHPVEGALHPRQLGVLASAPFWHHGLDAQYVDISRETVTVGTVTYGGCYPATEVRDRVRAELEHGINDLNRAIADLTRHRDRLVTAWWPNTAPPVSARGSPTASWPASRFMTAGSPDATPRESSSEQGRGQLERQGSGRGQETRRGPGGGEVIQSGGGGFISVAMDPDRLTKFVAHAARYAAEHYQVRLAHYGEAEARKGAGSAALSVAVLAVAPPVESGEWYAGLMARVGYFFRGQSTGVDSARFTLAHFPRQAEMTAESLAEVADILEQSEVDMGEGGRTVRELRACVATLRGLVAITDPSETVIEFSDSAPDSLGRRRFTAYWLAGNVGSACDQSGVRSQVFFTDVEAFTDRQARRGRIVRARTT